MSHYQRIAFRIAAANATTPSGDTGRAVMGELVQVKWAPTTADTGADLSLVQVTSDAGDTAGSLPILTIEDLGSAIRQWAPRQAKHNVSGASDTGASGEPWVFAGDRLRAKVTPRGVAAVNGTLYAWIRK